NAVINSNSSNLKGCRIFVALFPCNECAKVIIQSGISEVVYLCDKYSDTDIVKASKKMFQMAGLRTRKLVPSEEGINISFVDEGADTK
ncbi:MAG: deaminase, partial [Fibrobacterota bacterium]